MKQSTTDSWGTIADIATAVGTLLALLGLILTLILTLRSQRLTREGQRLEREQAEATALRSEAAAALTEQYTQRIVDALETMASDARPVSDVFLHAIDDDSPAKGAPLLHRVRWSLRHSELDSYLLENVGNETARAVRVSADPSLLLREPAARDLAPGEAVEFLAVRTMGTVDSTITVHWIDQESGALATWQYPLPPHPPTERLQLR